MSQHLLKKWQPYLQLQHCCGVQFKVTTSRGCTRGDIEIVQYLHHDAGDCDLVIVEVATYCNAYANDHNISFKPAVTSTSGNVHCELLCILFL